jgi:hypothetical protein
MGKHTSGIKKDSNGGLLRMARKRAWRKNARA